MRKIDFFIAGVQKSGTTTIYDLLSQDSRIYLPKIKENPFFTNPEIKVDFYDRLYSGYNSELMCGGAYANAIFFHQSAKELIKHNPKIKIILILRNPIDRAYSAYYYSNRLGVDSTKSFESAINNEYKNNFRKYIDIANKTYLEHGHYYEQIVKYSEFIPLKRMHIILFEDLVQNEKEVLKGIYNFLGMDLDNSNNIKSIKSNASSVVKIKWLHKLVFDKNIIKTIYQKLMPENIRYFINYKIVKKLERINKTNAAYVSMKKETRKRLKEYYISHNTKLEKLLDVDLNDWKE